MMAARLWNALRLCPLISLIVLSFLVPGFKNGMPENFSILFDYFDDENASVMLDRWHILVSLWVDQKAVVISY